MNERELIARLQKRDEAAFEELIRQYEKKVYTLCFRMCGNSEDAEEAAQDAFLALWRGIDRFRQESSLSTWIYRLATNACIDTLRRRKKQSGSVSLDDEELFVDAVDTSPQPQETAEHREAQKLLQEGLSALPEEYRKVLILRELMGGTKRFGELKRAIGAVSQKVLTAQLRDMEDKGLLTRKVYAEVPPRVEYTLTPTGYSLKPILDAMVAWGTDYQRKNTAAMEDGNARDDT